MVNQIFEVASDGLLFDNHFSLVNLAVWMTYPQIQRSIENNEEGKQWREKEFLLLE